MAGVVCCSVLSVVIGYVGRRCRLPLFNVVGSCYLIVACCLVLCYERLCCSLFVVGWCLLLLLLCGDVVGLLVFVCDIIVCWWTLWLFVGVRRCRCCWLVLLLFVVVVDLVVCGCC